MKIPSIRFYWASGAVTIHTMAEGEKLAENKWIGRHIVKAEWL